MLAFESFESVKDYLCKAEWPQYSQSWYYAGHESKFKVGRHTFDFFEYKLMIFRNEQNQLTALERNCLHMHADLSKGKFKNGQISCPMHDWKYNTKGKCLHLTEERKLKEFPLEVWMGHVFVFCGDDANYFPFPKFEIPDEQLMMSKRTIIIRSQISWYLLAGNGFDLHHFDAVHHRELTSEANFKKTGPNKLLTQLEFKNNGTHIFDRILKSMYGDKMSLYFEVAGANLILAISKLSKKNNYMFFCIQPHVSGNTSVYLFFLKEKSIIPFYDKISLLIRRVFIKRFFQEELDSVKELVMTPKDLTEEDIFLMNYLMQTHKLSIRK